jgi:hypothetical protein
MGLHDPFGHLKHKLWSKERPRDFWPLKVKNRPDFFVCRWHATYRWKALDKGYNFDLKPIAIRGLHTKLWAPKVARILVVGIPGLPLRSLETKCHLDVVPVERHRKYYKGEGSGFPQVWAVVSQKLPMVHPSTQKCWNYALTNVLFSLCKSKWVNKLLVILPNPSLELQHTLLPPKCYKPGNVPNSLLFRCSHFKFTFEFIQELRSTSNVTKLQHIK